ncbi:LysR family transcriptional regulator [Novosphingobium terrae]|uniref:LysR family transcriptional regulator n=1 Tax=Novosphingobium terrae TaxID=2726189 RepID=UPI0019824FE7|nr:LysR family transcriptional regulator [Novosphingobium terrae]
MDWEDVRSFLAIARMRTLSGAARSLGVRQSTMSRRLSALEQRAGARLLQKTPAGYELTGLGEAVLGNAERMEAEAIAVERMVQGRDVALSGVVRVTTVDIMASRLMPGTITRLQARYPGISVDVLADIRSLSLSRREADLAIRMVPFEGRELVARRMGRASGALYASGPYLAQHGRDLSSPDHSVITLLEDQAHMPEARWLAQMVPHARVAMRSNSRETQGGAAAAGLGLACLPCYLGDGLPGLEKLKEAGGPPPREVWLGVHPDLRHMPRIRAVIDALDAEFAAQVHLLAPDD